MKYYASKTRKQFYIVDDGRINIAGLRSQDITKFAGAGPRNNFKLGRVMAITVGEIAVKTLMANNIDQLYCLPWRSE